MSLGSNHCRGSQPVVVRSHPSSTVMQEKGRKDGPRNRTPPATTSCLPSVSRPPRPGCDAGRGSTTSSATSNSSSRPPGAWTCTASWGWWGGTGSCGRTDFTSRSGSRWSWTGSSGNDPCSDGYGRTCSHSFRTGGATSGGGKEDGSLARTDIYSRDYPIPDPCLQSGLPPPEDPVLPCQDSSLGNRGDVPLTPTNEEVGQRVRTRHARGRARSLCLLVL